MMLFPPGDMWVPVRIKVSDGEVSRSTDLEVWIEDVPDTPDLDDPPTIATIGALEFDEDTEFILDLAPFVQDPDTAEEDLTVTVDEVNCTVDGLVLTFYFEDVTGTLDLEVMVVVSDGNSTASRKIRVRVNDIPDVPPPPPDVWPPVIIEVPVQRFQVNTARVIDLSPFVTDQDTLAELLTLSSSQGEVLEIRGWEMTVLFESVPPEGFTITFTVSDGVHQVDGSFGVVVKEADADPRDHWYTSNAGLLGVIVVIVVVLVAVAYMNRQRYRS